MKSLFPSDKITIDVPNASIEYFPNFFDAEKCKLLFDKLLNEIPWQQDTIRVYGKNHPQPRLTALLVFKYCNATPSLESTYDVYQK